MDIYCRCGEPWSCQGIHHTTSDLSIHNWRELLRGAGCPSCEGDFKPSDDKDDKWRRSVVRANEDYVEITFPVHAYIPEYCADNPGASYLKALEAFGSWRDTVQEILHSGLAIVQIDSDLYVGFEDPHDYGRTYSDEDEARQEARNKAITKYLDEYFEAHPDYDGFLLKVATLPNVYHGNSGSLSYQHYMDVTPIWRHDLLNSRLLECRLFSKNELPSELEECIEAAEYEAVQVLEAECEHDIEEAARTALQDWGLPQCLADVHHVSTYSNYEGTNREFCIEKLIKIVSNYKPVGWECFHANNHYVLVPTCSPGDPDDWQYGKPKTEISGYTLVGGEVTEELGWMSYPIHEFEVNGVCVSIAWHKLPSNIRYDFVAHLLDQNTK